MEEESTKIRRRRQINRNRAIIMKSAKDLFLKNGLHKTTMDDIAQYSGFDRRTLYNHFKNKEEIFSALISEAIFQIRKAYDEATKLELSPLDRIKTLILNLLELYTENSGLINMFVSEFDQPDTKRKKHISSLMHDNISSYRKLESTVIELIKDAQREGQVADVHPMLLSGLFSIMLIRAVVILEQNKKTITKEDITRDIMRIIQGQIIK